MGRYQVNIDSFEITNTRSGHNDTDHITLAVSLDGIQQPPIKKDTGDVNNGIHQVDPWFQLQFETRSLGQPVVVSYAIINTLDYCDQQLVSLLAYAANALVNTAGNLVGAFPGGITAGATAGAAAVVGPGVEASLVAAAAAAIIGSGLKALSLFEGGCDGPVAIDQFFYFASALAELTACGPQSQRGFYDYCTQCRRSHYYVNWTIKTIQALHLAGRAIARYPTRLDVFWIGADGTVANNWWDANLFCSQSYLPSRQYFFGKQWNQPSSLPQVIGAAPLGEITTVARYADHQDLFWLGNDGSVMSACWDAGINNAQWNTAFSIGQKADPSSGLVAISRYANQLDVFWIGEEGSVWSAWWNQSFNGGQWVEPFIMAGPAAPGSRLAVVAGDPTEMDLFWIAPRGSVMHTAWKLSTGQWSAQEKVGDGASIGGGLAATSWPDSSQVNVYWVGTDGSLMTTGRNLNVPHGDRWAPQSSEPGAGPGSVAPESPIAALWRLDEFATRYDLFWVADDGSVWMIEPVAVSPLGSGANQVAPKGYAFTGPGGFLRALSRTSQHIDVFWAGSDGSIMSNWWDLNSNEARWNTPIWIAPPGSTAMVSSGGTR